MTDQTKKPKIAVIGGSPFNNSLFTAMLANHIAKAGVDIDVINPEDDEQLGKACDEAAEKLGFLHVVDGDNTSADLSKFNRADEAYPVCLDVADERPVHSWKQQRSKGNHKANARKSAKKRK